VRGKSFKILGMELLMGFYSRRERERERERERRRKNERNYGRH
jgi:hypothetical protein